MKRISDRLEEDEEAYFAGGAMDFEKIHFNEVVSLSEGLSYQIKVKKKK